MRNLSVRRFVSAFLLLLFAAQFGLLQAVLGRARVLDLVTSSALLLALTMFAAARLRRTMRVLLAVSCAFVLVLQLHVFRYYHTPLDIQVAASALFAKHDVLPVVWRAAPFFTLSWLIASLVELALLEVSKPAWSSRALGASLAMAALGGLIGDVPRRSTPEVQALNALGALGLPQQHARGGAVALPELLSDRAELPSVLFVLTESVRAADYGPATAPETAALLPTRIDLTELRAVSSYTALSVSAVLTGRPQTGPREAIACSPSLFDFVHATREYVGYFSAQSETVFETPGVRGAVDRFVTVETLRGRDVEDDDNYVDLPLDHEMVDAFEKALPDLPRPLVTMLHFAGTHTPYFVDPARAPFAPFDHTVAWSGLDRLHNAYRDAIFEQDRTLARALRAFLTHVGKRPWIVVFTSDHGEAFGESGAIHHGQNLLDEQVHVPAFIASGNGALTAAQEAALRDHAARFITHLDLLPTVLDALGIWDSSALARYRAALPGKSLLRPWEARAPISVTNCTPMFPCPSNTWGFYDGDRKLLARVYDNDFRCFAIGRVEERLVDGPDATCNDLRARSRVTFPVLPNGAPNR